MGRARTTWSSALQKKVLCGMERNRNPFQRIFRKRREGWGRMNEMTGRKVMIVKKGLERKLG
jgi:hypothetical protein